MLREDEIVGWCWCVVSWLSLAELGCSNAASAAAIARTFISTTVDFHGEVENNYWPHHKSWGQSETLSCSSCVIIQPLSVTNYSAPVHC